MIGRRRRDHRVAGPTGQLLAHVPDHLEAARHVIEGLGHVLADPAQGAAAMRAGAGGRVTHLFARQMIGQWPARRLLRSRPRPRSLPATIGEAVASRSAWSALQRSRSPARAARSRAPASPRSGRTRPAGSAPAGNFSLAISACAATASRAISAMMRFSAAMSSGRLSGAIVTPAIGSDRQRLGARYTTG